MGAVYRARDAKLNRDVAIKVLLPGVPAEIFVRSFPGPGGPWQISAGGGTDPIWSPTRSELLWRRSLMGVEGLMMAAPYSAEGTSFRAQTPRPWSDNADARFATSQRQRSVAIHPDGERLALGLRADQVDAPKNDLVFVAGFFDELRRLVPAASR